MFELLTHRECGTAYLRAYADGPQPTFLWSTPSGPFREGQQPALSEVQVLVEPANPHFQQSIPAWLDTRSGKLAYSPPADPTGFIRVGLPPQNADWVKNGLRFQACCVCGEPTQRGESSSIMDHATKGEAPFANSWYQCSECTALLPIAVRGHCASCATGKVEPVTPTESPYIRARKGFWRDPVENVLLHDARLRSISVEEHTAQLSNRDNARVHATTEQFELRFKDVRIAKSDKPIDVLSCTTTMEVGVDIGSLVAVGLRNVPPQRENYQQRAGRAGRRGSSLSTVLTYAQNGPHDSYFYNNPTRIVAGDPRNPDIKVDNPKIARRHIAAYLFQTFFHGYMDAHDVEC